MIIFQLLIITILSTVLAHMNNLVMFSILISTTYYICYYIAGAFFTVTTTVVVDLLGIENAARGQAISSLFMGSGFLLGTPFAGTFA